jgi:hypothetical protein
MRTPQTDRSKPLLLPWARIHQSQLSHLGADGQRVKSIYADGLQRLIAQLDNALSDATETHT